VKGETIRIAIDAMLANPLRTFLSTLGVVIGVAALVAILALSDGLERYSRSQIESTTDLQTIVLSVKSVDVVDGVAIRRESPVRLTEGDAAELEQLLEPFGGKVAIFAAGSGWISIPGDTTGQATYAVATTPEAESMMPQSVQEGRFLRETDRSSETVVVLSSSLAAALARSPDRTGELVGRSVAWNRADPTWTVIGIVGDRPADPMKRAWIPFSDANSRLLDPENRRPPSIGIRVDRIEDLPVSTAEIERWLVDRFGDTWKEEIGVATNRRRVDQVKQAMLVFKLVMGAIAGIALLVGGIGIMNVLLASVSERTREIGTRKAVGARGRDVNRQFLIESVVITGSGSLLGILMGMASAAGIAAAVRRFTGAPVSAAFTWPSVVIAVGAALVVGLVFGTWPARRAAGLSPVEALRDE
jgi:putative ABC transport system permease protein